MSVSVRPRTPTDLEACVELLGRVHHEDGYPDVWPADPAGWLTPRGLLGAWVAELDGLVVGHAAATAATGHDGAVWSAHSGLPLERLGAIKRMFAAPDRRGVGIGRALLGTGCDALDALGLHPALDVMNTNVAAIALYQREGWACVAAEPWPHPPPGRTLYYYIGPQPGSTPPRGDGTEPGL